MAKEKQRHPGNTGAGKVAITSLSASPRYLKGWLPLAWFAVLALLLYGQSISYQYTFLDDHNLVLYNMDNLRTLSYVQNAFTEDVFHMPEVSTYYYRPVMTLSFMADAMLGQGSFAMFHFSNILYHVWAAWLLFLLFIMLKISRVRSFFVTLIFLVHPVLAQAVAWVPGRNDTLLAIFILLSCIAWIRYMEKPSALSVTWHLLAYLLALLTKESAIVLPVMLLFYVLLFQRKSFRLIIIPAVGWIFLTTGWFLVRNTVTVSQHGVPFITQLMSVAGNLPANLPYLGKILLPADLSVFPVMEDMKLSLIFGILAVALIGLVWKFGRPFKPGLTLFGILWFLIFLIPSLVFMPGQVPAFSEHRIYVSMIGILMIVVNVDSITIPGVSKIHPAIPGLAVILLFGILTFIHIRNFRDQFAFWGSAVESSPSHAFNFKNLGSIYVQEGDLASAEKYLRRAIALNPAEPLANSDLGYVCVMTGRPAEAEKYYLEEIRVNPKYDHVHFNLGLLYFNNGHPEQGVRELEKTLEINPVHTGAYEQLLIIYQKLERQADYDRIANQAKKAGVEVP
jgi:hypothetical protein